MQIYIAGPLFTLAERRFNEELAEAIASSGSAVRVMLPQREVLDLVGKPEFSKLAFRRCLDGVDACDAVVAVIDGADADSGTCVEIGYAMAKGKRVVGVRTDFRGSEDHGVNLMVANACSHVVVRSSAEVRLESLAAEIVSWIDAGQAGRPGSE